MEVIIACGLADPKGAWGAFLVKGLYDMRLFLHVAAYKGETLEELVRWATKGIEVLPLPESEVDECEKELRELATAQKEKNRFPQMNLIVHAGASLRKYSQEWAHNNADRQWIIIVRRATISQLKQAIARGICVWDVFIIFNPCKAYDDEFINQRSLFFSNYH